MSNRGRRPVLLSPLSSRLDAEPEPYPAQGRYSNYLFRASPREQSYGIRVFTILLVCVLLNTATLIVENHMYYRRPVPSEESPFGPRAVAATRATLEGLVSGPRVTGTAANEVVATSYILNVLQRIQAAAADDVNIEIDVQRPSGSFHTEFLNSFTNTYCNITNIAVRLSLKRMNLPLRSAKHSPHAVLVNAHFDSFVMSPGASDDGLPVALVLEVLRLMSSREHPSSKPGRLRNPVIFLFNGAEESNLQGSHGFISQHKWAHSVRALINLEAIGSGGRELMFQCNSPWIAQVYADSAPYPHCSGIAHELFQLALWRAAATDWRPIIEFGPPAVAGADFAYVENGYAYHTSFDKADIIDDGSIMHTGSNALQFICALSAAPELSLPLQKWAAINNMKLAADHSRVETPYDSKFVFFDVLGLFAIVYSGWALYALHVGVLILAASVCWARLPDVSALIDAAKHVFYSQGMCMLVALLVGLMYSTFAPMRWYDGGYQYSTLIFVPPIVLTELIIHERALFRGSFGANEAAILEVSGVVYWALLLILATAIGHRGSYLFLMWTVFGSFSLICRSVVGLIQKSGSTVPESYWRHAVMEVCPTLFLIPPTLCWFYQLTDGLELVVPLMGKTGHTVSGEILLALIYGWSVGSYLKTPLMMPLQSLAVCDYIRENKSNMRKLTVYPLAIGALMWFLYSIFFSPSFSAARPKRLWVHHLERDLTGRGEGVNTGLWVVGFDAQGLAPLTAGGKESAWIDGTHRTSSFRGTWFPDGTVPGDLTTRPATLEHRQGFNCGILNGECYLYWPYYFPVAEVLRDAVYIPAVGPDFRGNNHEESEKSFVLDVAASNSINGVRTINIFLAGPTHLTLAIRCQERVLRWGLLQTTDENSKPTFLHKPIVLTSAPPPRALDGIHYIQIGFGVCSGACLFRMQLEVTGTTPIDISAYGHYVLMRSTPELNGLKNELPAWSKGAEWTYFVSKLIATKV